MPKKADPRPDHEHAGKVCKKCGRAAIARADGTLMHDRRGAAPTPPSGTSTPPGGENEQEPEEKPDREHPFTRTIFGRKGDK